MGEGFSALRQTNGDPAFKIGISIEKEASAHATLQLRAFFRQFGDNVPSEYYQFLKGKLGHKPEEQLYPLFKEQYEEAKKEALCLTLGEDNRKINHAINNAIGTEDCILIGGPPCQAYSLVGRSRNYGAKDKKYSASDDHRNFLYKEYLKVIARFQPLVFVMENVKGMLSAKIDGELIFPSIMQDLQDPCKSVDVRPQADKPRHKYRIFSFVTNKDSQDLYGESQINPKDFVIKAEKYGVPQARHRVILLGVREDLTDSVNPKKMLKEFPHQVTVEQVISDLPELRSKLSKGGDSVDSWKKAIRNIPTETLAKIKNDKHVPIEVNSLYNHYIRSIEISPDTTGCDKGQTRSAYNEHMPKHLKSWYTDQRLKSHITNHESRGHISGDLYRYLYYSTYASIMSESPKSHNLPEALWPDHKNFHSGKFADRFRVQLADSAGTTVTSHISKDGHYFIHYDPTQCRSLTVREAARIQTFPDNYYFVGNRTQQYVQVGNAVPPYLAKQLASIVSDIIG